MATVRPVRGAAHARLSVSAERGGRAQRQKGASETTTAPQCVSWQRAGGMQGARSGARLICGGCGVAVGLQQQSHHLQRRARLSGVVQRMLLVLRNMWRARATSAGRTVAAATTCGAVEHARLQFGGSTNDGMHGHVGAPYPLSQRLAGWPLAAVSPPSTSSRPSQLRSEAAVCRPAQCARAVRGVSAQHAAGGARGERGG